jgi:hypothetical protein
MKNLDPSRDRKVSLFLSLNKEKSSNLTLNVTPHVRQTLLPL